jgi:hypothetical protein
MRFLVIHILTYHIIFSKVGEAKENQGKMCGKIAIFAYGI